MKNLTSQNQKFDTSKNERGITLVALIITIIILIILAVVTINALTHDGLADMAIKGAESYDKAQTDEMNMLNEIDSTVRETLKNIEEGTRPEKPTPPDFSDTIDLVNNNIGASIDYQPASGTYSTTQIVDGVSSECSGSTEQTFQTSDLTGGWNIWKVDNNNIYLISENATTKNLILKGVRGYNNGVTLLDNICDTVFTDKTSYPNMKGRNLKLEDVLAVKSSSATNGNSNYGKTPYSYSFKYPYIWNQYEKTQANPTANRSTAYPLTTQDALTSNISAIPYSTYWHYGNQNWNSATYWTSAAYHKMVLTPTQSNVYWLSSRFVNPGSSSYCNFGLQSLGSSGVGRYDLYNYNSGSPNSGYNSSAMRPLVKIPLTSCEITQNSDGTFHIAPRG